MSDEPGEGVTRRADHAHEAESRGVNACLEELGTQGLASISALLAASLALAACSDLDGFKGTFEGQIVGQSDGDAFIRSGFTADTTLRLVFDPSTAATSPGTMTTRTADGAVSFFDSARLLAIPPLEHDLLSAYDLPDGRVRSYIFVSRVRDGAILGSDSIGGRDATVFVSLMKGGAIELRIVVGAGTLFGLFRLEEPEEEDE